MSVAVEKRNIAVSSEGPNHTDAPIINAPGSARPTSAGDGGEKGGRATASDGPLSWQYDIPLLTNPYMLWDFLRLLV
ncbi:MAG TPA: hypothetical protein VJM69_03145, partial [Dehalococcoidia bacterium]|nr:hypothetical protein [Dehalococcoidia bacterium]